MMKGAKHMVAAAAQHAHNNRASLYCENYTTADRESPVWPRSEQCRDFARVHLIPIIPIGREVSPSAMFKRSIPAIAPRPSPHHQVDCSPTTPTALLPSTKSTGGV